MRNQAPSLAITEAEFRQALVEAEKLTEEELRKVSGASAARSYYVQYQGKTMSLKAVLRLAYIRAEKKWDGPQSAAAARQLKNAFDICYRSYVTEPSSSLDHSKKSSVAEMVRTLMNTVSQSNGQIVDRRIKEKNTELSSSEWESLLLRMIEKQENRCALTNLPLDYSSESDDLQMRPSLDRIDSQGHYTPDNVQIVCRFINRWKGTDDDGLVRKLIKKLHSCSCAATA